MRSEYMHQRAGGSGLITLESSLVILSHILCVEVGAKRIRRDSLLDITLRKVDLKVAT
jgi:hypothetical protein